MKARHRASGNHLRIKWIRPAVLTAMIVAAVLVVSAQPDWAAMALCLPVLVVIPGWALMTLLMGPVCRRSDDVPSPDNRNTDPVVRWPLAILLGVLADLFVALAIHFVGLGFAPRTAAVAVGVCSVSLVVLAAWTHPAVVRFRRLTLRDLPLALVGVPCAAAVLLTAVAFARELQPNSEEQFTTLSFVNAPLYEADIDVTVGLPVTFDWVLRGYGREFTGGTPSIAAEIDGNQVPAEFHLGAPPHASAGASAELRGTVTLFAPSTPGRYEVRIAVTLWSPDPAVVAQPEWISTFLRVSE